MAIFVLSNKIEYKHWFIYILTTENHDGRLPNLSSQLFTFSCLHLLEKKCTPLKNHCLVLCSKWSSFRVMSRRSTDYHVTRTKLQPCSTSHSSPLNCPQYAYCGKSLKKSWRLSLALIVAVNHSGTFMMTGKSTLYFKSSGKVKSKWLIGRRLWILLKSIWLRIKVFVWIIIMAWNS